MPFLGNIGPGELIILLVIILVIFGPGRLPEIGNAVGKGIREFRKAASDVTEATQINPPASPPTSAPPTVAQAAPPAPPAGPSAAGPAASAPASSDHADDEAEARRRYEELKSRFEPAAADQSHGDAGQSSA